MKTKEQIKSQIEELKVLSGKYHSIEVNLESIAQNLINLGSHSIGEELFILTRTLYNQARYRDGQIKALEFVLNDRIEAL